MKKKYPRNMIGYGSKTPTIKWPNNAKLALQIVLNYEEGSENCILHGDKHSETFLSEIIGAQPIKGRHINMESFYEYGSININLKAYLVDSFSGDFKLVDHDMIEWIKIEDIKKYDFAPADMPINDYLLENGL